MKVIFLRPIPMIIYTFNDLILLYKQNNSVIKAKKANIPKNMMIFNNDLIILDQDDE